MQSDEPATGLKTKDLQTKPRIKWVQNAEWQVSARLESHHIPPGRIRQTSHLPV